MSSDIPTPLEDAVRAELRRSADAAPTSVRPFAQQARAEARQLRRMRVATVIGAVFCTVAVLVAVLLVRGHPNKPVSRPAVLPADQPRCAAAPPSQSAVPALDHSAPIPELATVCGYDVSDRHLANELGQIRPGDIPAFIAYVRGFAKHHESCPRTAESAPVSLITVEMLFPAGATGTLTAASDSDCTSLTDGATTVRVLNGTLADSDWGAVLTSTAQDASPTTSPYRTVVIPTTPAGPRNEGTQPTPTITIHR